MDNFNYFCGRVRGLLDSLPTCDDILKLKTEILFERDYVYRYNSFKYVFTDTIGSEMYTARPFSLHENRYVVFFASCSEFDQYADANLQEH